MWGSYVQGAIDKEIRGAKNNSEAERKSRGIIEKLLKENEREYRRNADKDANGNPVIHEMPPVRRGGFRDPASVIRTSE